MKLSCTGLLTRTMVRPEAPRLIGIMVIGVVGSTARYCRVMDRMASVDMNGAVLTRFCTSASENGLNFTRENEGCYSVSNLLPLSLADAETRKDHSQQILGVDLAGDFAEGVEGFAEVNGGDFRVGMILGD